MSDDVHVGPKDGCIYEARDIGGYGGASRAYCRTHQAWAGECKKRDLQRRVETLEQIVIAMASSTPYRLALDEDGRPKLLQDHTTS